MASQISIVKAETQIIEQIKKAQQRDQLADTLKARVLRNETKDFEITQERILKYKRRTYIPPNLEIKGRILEEAYKSCYTIHPGMTKMHWDLKESFWWPSMKRDVTDYMSRYLTCQKVKTEHQKL
ncbi:uncharacterized protein LOC114757145 [Neltuma alba]|uniref:uncharacterized protein LOC114757145 n=1 Tax=Neltuma alba TaxID=207710 RepID=UPI0010A48521|nr:uncharacterized protein LOC114757145 [Prosopis alba]